MNGRELDVELDRAVDAVRLPHIRRLEALGVPMAAIAELGAVQPQFGVERVRWLSGGLYEPDPEGVPAVISPVIAGAGFAELGLVDLVAWTTNDPARWSWRVGSGWALGDDLLSDDCNDPVSVVATPRDWLAAGGRALCVLDWGSPPKCWSRLRSGPSLQFSDDALRERVRNALVRNVALPRMEILDAA